MTADNVVLAIDPGRDKCGIAVVAEDGRVLYKSVILRISLAVTTESLLAQYAVRTVVVGDGTTSAGAVEEIGKINLTYKGVSIVTVNEYRSTDEARDRYWRENPPQGFKRLIPVTLQVPPAPVDDYVAVILAERYFKNSSDER